MKDIVIDARGLLCPLPVLRLRKRLQEIEAGTIVTLVATDPAALVDVPHFCAENGHEFLASTEHGDTVHYRLRRA